MRTLLILFLFGSSLTAADPEKTYPSFLAPGAEVEQLATGMKFTEGPVWIPGENQLIFSDIPNSKLMRWSESGGLSVFREESHQTNGNILDLEGRLISCQHAARNVIRTEKDGSITVLAEKWSGKRFNSPNDVAVKSDGTLWFTDPPWGLREEHEIQGHWVFKLEPESGKVTPVVKDLAMPNGIVFSPDEKRLYIADTGGHKRHPDAKYHDFPDRVYCYAIKDDGTLGERLFHIDGGSDGMAMDTEGNLYTTHKGKVHIFDRDGKKLSEIDVPEGPANVTFGGPDFDTLYITARKSLYRAKVIKKGAKPPGAKW